MHQKELLDHQVEAVHRAPVQLRTNQDARRGKGTGISTHQAEALGLSVSYDIAPRNSHKNLYHALAG